MRRPLSLIATALVVPQAGRCFTVGPLASGTTTTTTTTTAIYMTSPPPAGSFFNPVPSNDDSNQDEKEESKKDLNDEVTELLRQRKSPARATRPSTINGVPTSKATGFGKPKDQTIAKTSNKPYIAVGPPDKKLNDPSNPEYDDQGYTLYSNETTGEKQRVFEALVDYPCDFTMKIVGASEGTFVEDMVAVVAEACGTDASLIPHSTRAMGKWTSVTVKAPVKSAVMLYTLYEKVDLDPRVKFKF